MVVSSGCFVVDGLLRIHNSQCIILANTPDTKTKSGARNERQYIGMECQYKERYKGGRRHEDQNIYINNQIKKCLMIEYEDETKTERTLLLEIRKKLEEQQLWQKEFLKPADVAAMLGVSIDYVYQLTAKKVLPLYCPTGKLKYIAKSDLMAFMRGNRQLSEAEVREAAKQNIKRRGR